MCVCIYIYEHHYKLFSILTRLRASRYNNSPTNMYIHIYRYICILVYLCVCVLYMTVNLWKLIGFYGVHYWDFTVMIGFPQLYMGWPPAMYYIYRHTLYTLYISYMYIQTAKCLPVTLSVWISCTHIFLANNRMITGMITAEASRCYQYLVVFSQAPSQIANIPTQIHQARFLVGEYN